MSDTQTTPNTETQAPTFKPKKSVALSGVPAGNTALCTVGRSGNDLSYRGYDILDLVMDNYATHKTPKIKAWLARRPHWHIHFTPTSASWINQVERWFAELTRKQLQRGVHRSTAELEADITAFIAAHNEDPKPYKWIKSADEILAAVKRFCQRTDRTLCSEL